MALHPSQDDVAEIYMDDQEGTRQVVRVGSRVRFRKTDISRMECFEVRSYQAREQRYGDTVFTIEHICRWPCGQVDLYLNNGAGVRPSDFIAV